MKLIAIMAIAIRVRRFFCLHQRGGKGILQQEKMNMTLRIILCILFGIYLLYRIYYAIRTKKAKCYSADELEAVHDHIETRFGTPSFILHETFSQDIHVDIAVIPPGNEQNFYTLITMGMGAHLMNVPQEDAAARPARAELLITLPPEWQLTSESLQDPHWNWPLRWLRTIATMPYLTNSWLAPAHTFSGDTPEPLSPDTELNSFIILHPEADEQTCEISLPGGEKVCIYQLYPLYPDELEYAFKHGSAKLIELIEQQTPNSRVIHPSRAHLTLPLPHQPAE